MAPIGLLGLYGILGKSNRPASVEMIGEGKEVKEAQAEAGLVRSRSSDHTTQEYDPITTKRPRGSSSQRIATRGTRRSCGGVYVGS